MESSRGNSTGRAAFGLLELGLLFVTPLAFYRGFSDQFTTIKLILTKSLVLVAALGLMLRFVWTRRGWPRHFRIGVPLALLVSVVLLSCLGSSTPTFSFAEAGNFLCGPVWALVLIFSGGGESRMRRIAALVTAASGMAAAIAVSQWAGHDPLLFGGYHVEFGTMRASMRMYSTFGNPNLAAGYLTGAIFLGGALAAVSNRFLVRVLCAAAVLLTLAAVTGEDSQGAWLGLVAGLVVALAFFAKGPAPTVPAAPRANSAIIGASAMPAALLLPLAVLAQQASELFTSLEGRTFLWRASWPMFAQHPLLGGGWGTFQLRFPELQAQFLASHPQYLRYWTYTSHLHNDPLEILLDAGAAALAALGWLLWIYMRDLRHSMPHSSRPERIWLAASAGGVTAILLNACFNFQLAVPPTLLLLFTFLAAPLVLRMDTNAPMPSGGAPKLFGRVLLTAVVASLAVWMAIGMTYHARADHFFAIGLDAERRGEIAKAEEHLRRGLEQEPENGGLHYGLARALYLQGEDVEALAGALHAGRSLSDPHLEVLKARIQDRLGYRSQALEAFRHALRLDPALDSVRADIERLSRAP